LTGSSPGATTDDSPAQRNTTSSCSCFPRNQAAMADVSLIELLDQLNLSKYREVMEENEVR
jgi:hypothetical protein